MKKRMCFSIVVFGAMCAMFIYVSQYSELYAQASTGDWGCWITDGGKCSWDARDWGAGDYTPLVGDVNGDGKADRILYRPTDGDWGCWITDGSKCSWDAHDWGSASYVPLVGDVNSDGKADRILHEVAMTSRVIDLTISLDGTASTDRQKAPYIGIIEHFADAIYEMSNGAHKIGTVTVFQNGHSGDTADIVWTDSEWPHVPGGCVSGIGQRGCRINMGDTFPFPTPYVATQADNWQGAGYALAHEWGHYYYGLYDEYNGNTPCSDAPSNIFDLQTCDSMPDSVMERMWNALADNNYIWLNFGIAANQTQHNVNWRVYGASGWDVLARSPNQDPRDGQRRSSTRLTYFPELAVVAPVGNSASSIELPTPNARSHLQINWTTPPAINHATNAGTTNSYIPVIRLTNGNSVRYPEAAILIAMLSKDGGFVAKSGIAATVTAPDQSTKTVLFRDDGIAPDAKADDGLYTVSWLYTQNGEHTVTVQFDNTSGAAQIAYAGNHYVPDPDGEGYQPLPKSISENFTERIALSVHVNGYPQTINAPQPPTQLTIDNRDFPGRIDSAGDKDTFTFTTTVFTATKTSELVVRLTALDHGMQPHIKIFEGATSPSLIVEHQFVPSENNYFITRLTVEAQHTFNRFNLRRPRAATASNQPCACFVPTFGCAGEIRLAASRQPTMCRGIPDFTTVGIGE